MHFSERACSDALVMPRLGHPSFGTATKAGFLGLRRSSPLCNPAMLLEHTLGGLSRENSGTRARESVAGARLPVLQTCEAPTEPPISPGTMSAPTPWAEDVRRGRHGGMTGTSRTSLTRRSRSKVDEREIEENEACANDLT